MKEKTYTFDYRSMSRHELPSEDTALIAAAEQAAQKAYAPFSNFRVGAALRLDDGTVLTANNQESEAFPSGMCAERNLLFYAQANFPESRIEALALRAIDTDNICTPCGGCRQIMAEAEKRQGSPIHLIMAAKEQVTVTENTYCLLPFQFHLA